MNGRKATTVDLPMSDLYADPIAWIACAAASEDDDAPLAIVERECGCRANNGNAGENQKKARNADVDTKAD